MADANIESNMSFKVEIVPFNGKNYHSWKFQMKMVLMSKGLWGIVTGTDTEPTGEGVTNEERRKWRNRQDIAYATISLAVESKQQTYVRHTDNAKDAWNELAVRFEKKSLSARIHYRRKLYSLRMIENENVLEHIEKLKVIAEQLEDIGDPIKETELCIILLSSLPESFDHLITALEKFVGEDETKLTWDFIRNALMREDDKKSYKLSDDHVDSNTQDALIANKKGFTPVGDHLKCERCGKLGHIAAKCYAKMPNKSGKSGRFPGKCHTCGKTGHKAKDCWKGRSNVKGKPEGNIDNAAMKMGPISTASWWCIDSGASQHMSYMIDSMTGFQKFKKPVEIYMGDNSVLLAFGKGNMDIKVCVHSEQRTVKLTNVLFAPKLKQNLLSIKAASAKGWEFHFSNNDCEIMKDGKLRAYATLNGSLYRLVENTAEFAAVTAISSSTDNKLNYDIWHHRFGHLGQNNVKLLHDKELVNGMKCTGGHITQDCEACIQGKMTKKPFPKLGNNEEREILELVHSDVCGPMPIKSLAGSMYFVTFIDDRSRYTAIYFLKKKSEVFQKFKHYIAWAEKFTGKQVKILRSDNGGEYMSDEFQRFCSERGIQRQFTIAHTPKQNGVSERMNRTIMEAARSMLCHSKMPQRFWAEAVNTAVYLRNRSPTAA